MALGVLFVTNRKTCFSSRLHPVLGKCLFQMEQMELFIQMKSSGHLSDCPLGDWKTMWSVASLLGTLVDLMV